MKVLYGDFIKRTWWIFFVTLLAVFINSFAQSDPRDSNLDSGHWQEHWVKQLCYERMVTIDDLVYTVPDTCYHLERFWVLDSLKIAHQMTIDEKLNLLLDSINSLSEEIDYLKSQINLMRLEEK